MLHQEPVTKLSSRRHKAAKQYRCMICDGVIEIGEEHERLVYRLNDTLDRKRGLRSVRFHCKCPPSSWRSPDGSAQRGSYQR